MKTIKYILILLASVLFLQQNILAVEVDELLLDRLVEKGTLTQEDAAAIRADAAIKTQEELAQKKKFNVEGNTKFELGGYFQGQYIADETVGSFDEFRIRRARFDFKGDVSKNVGWRIQLDAVQTLKSVTATVSQSSTTKNVTTSTTKAVVRPVILDGYIDYKFYSFANFRIGQFYIPFSQENLQTDAKSDTINRSQVTEKLVPGRDNGSQGRDIGGQISGEYVTERKILEYTVGIFNGAGINTGDDNENKDVAGRVLVFPIQGLVVGVAHYNGKSGLAETNKIRTGAEISYIFTNASLKAEYVSGNDGVIEKYGWYVLSGYRFIPELETIVKYDSYDPDKSKTNDRTDMVTLGLNWSINKWTRIQTNYEWKTEEGTQVNNNDFLTQFQVQF